MNWRAAIRKTQKYPLPPAFWPIGIVTAVGAMALQAGVPSRPLSGFVAALTVVVLVALIWNSWPDRRLAYLVPICFGGLLNVVVVCANGFSMPTTGLTEPHGVFIPATGTEPLFFLADRWGGMASIGDMFVGLGLFIWVGGFVLRRARRTT